MQRIEVHPDVLDEKARFVQQKKQELERMVWELEKSIYLLQSDWSGVTGERFFWDFMQVKEVFPTTLGILDKIQNEFTFVAKNFRTTDGSGEVALYIPEELKPTFAKGLADGSVGETVTGFGQTLEAFIYSPLSTAGSLAYAFTLGRAVDAGRGIKFAWDAYWGNGTARSDVEQFVEDQKKQIDQDGLGYYSGSMAGQVLAYAFFGKAFRAVENKHSDLGGSGGSKPESGKENGGTSKTHYLVSVNKFEDQIRNEPLEHGQFFDQNGNLIGETIVGTEKSINLSNHKELAKDTVFTHNHPTNGPFSLEDIATAMDFNMEEIRAVLPNGANLSMKRGPEGWKENAEDLGSIFANVQKELRNDPKAQEYFKNGNKDAVWDMLFDRVSKKIGGEYTKS
ncbi:WXG100 family type VII secretion target [Paenibacillus sp. ACRRY]|uniref:WXG100 family type VII secretion target n=1 Tax=Paenibacillus sp. ACRRY TaxID=2918208 RepID=UPI001EF5864E|nr:WXG100 family type VII secretion target [Paenibacillus sp. ACRRY]MCG7384376.1 WXG100 family type VII secretion target [Paenibacillus sp. ACRRY]